MEESLAFTIKDALQYLQNQVKETNRSEGKNPENDKFEPFSNKDSGSFTSWVLKQIIPTDREIKTTRIVKSHGTETIFNKMVNQYQALQIDSKNILIKLKVIRPDYEISQTSDAKSDIEQPAPTKTLSNTIDQIQKEIKNEFIISNIARMKGKHLIEISKRNGYFMTNAGPESLEKAYQPDCEYRIVIEIAANFLDCMENTISKIIHSMLLLEITQEKIDDLVFMIVSGYREEEFRKFVNIFNEILNDDNKIKEDTELNLSEKKYLKMVMLKKMIKEHGHKVIFLHHPFSLRYCQIRDAKHSFENFCLEFEELEQDYNDDVLAFHKTNEKLQETNVKIVNLKAENQALDESNQSMRRELVRLLKDSVPY